MEHSFCGTFSKVGIFVEIIVDLLKNKELFDFHEEQRHFPRKLREVSEKYPKSPRNQLTSMFGTTSNEQFHMSSLKLLLSFVLTQKFQKKAILQRIRSVFFLFRGRCSTNATNIFFSFTFAALHNFFFKRRGVIVLK